MKSGAAYIARAVAVDVATDDEQQQQEGEAIDRPAAARQLADLASVDGRLGGELGSVGSRATGGK